MKLSIHKITWKQSQQETTLSHVSLDVTICYCSPSWLGEGTIRQYRWEYIVYVIVYDIVYGIIYDITLGKAKKTISYTILYKILYTILLQFNLCFVSFCLAGWRQIESKACYLRYRIVSPSISYTLYRHIFDIDIRYRRFKTSISNASDQRIRVYMSFSVLVRERPT